MQYRDVIANLVAAGALALAAGCATANDAAPAAVPVVPKLLVAFAAGPITIDGKLDEKAWAGAMSTGPFVGPINADANSLGGRPDYRTEAKLLWDAKTLYVAFLCRNPGPFWATYDKHDDKLYEQDVAEVFLDVAGDRLQYAEVQSSPRGVTFDCYHLWLRQPTYPADKLDWGFGRFHFIDFGWNLGGFVAAGAPLLEDGKEVGWVVEMRVPMAGLLEYRGLPTELRPGQIVYLNLLRYVYVPDPKDPENGKRQHRHLNWSPTMNGCPHVSPMADLPVQCAPPPVAAGQ